MFLHISYLPAFRAMQDRVQAAQPRYSCQLHPSQKVQGWYVLFVPSESHLLEQELERWDSEGGY